MATLHYKLSKFIINHKKLLNVIILAIWLLIMGGIIYYANSKVEEARRLVEEIEFIDSTATYNKIYYEKEFKALKKENKHLYDSLKQFKDKVSYLVQFTHEKEYSTGIVHTSKPTNAKKDTVHDTITVKEPLIAKTYEYTSEPNDTFQYKLNVNAYTEPIWYSIYAKVKNKFTIVNKEEGETNHLTIQPNNGGNISDVTAWKKKDGKTFWDRLSIGPSVTGGFGLINHKFDIMVGGSVTYNLK